MHDSKLEFADKTWHVNNLIYGNFNLEVKGQCLIRIMNIYATHPLMVVDPCAKYGMPMSKQTEVTNRRKTCQKPNEFNFEVKGQHRIGIKNVSKTLSHGNTTHLPNMVSQCQSKKSYRLNMNLHRQMDRQLLVYTLLNFIHGWLKYIDSSFVIWYCFTYLFHMWESIQWIPQSSIHTWKRLEYFVPRVRVADYLSHYPSLMEYPN